ncbi:MULTISPECIES: DUF2948 family protein [unclassified Minwuia]|jgi:Protein of unknown function (DUF2948)|uniref:DUF2948 family protein n=1 Tax=unclassified Minwuia TaxID=2618799 RepID=UPI0024794929|nr:MULTISPECIES: DUF2948 family protein [unclassified Minwuia]
MERGGQGEPLPRLHLHAVNADDLEILSAALVSMTVKRADLALQKARRRLAFVGNRFRWEDERLDGMGGSRIRAGVQINDVIRVRTQGMATLEGETVLELLSISQRPLDAPAAELTLNFAGGMTMLLDVDCIDVLMDDMGRPWYTPNQPDHGLDDPEQHNSES